MRILASGWFSFLDGEATAGDLLSKDVACGWLTSAGIDYDVAMSPVFDEGGARDTVDPQGYAAVLFVCGPTAGKQIKRLAERFYGPERQIRAGVAVPVACDERVARSQGRRSCRRALWPGFGTHACRTLAICRFLAIS